MGQWVTIATAAASWSCVREVHKLAPRGVSPWLQKKRDGSWMSAGWEGLGIAASVDFGCLF